MITSTDTSLTTKSPGAQRSARYRSLYPDRVKETRRKYRRTHSKQRYEELKKWKIKNPEKLSRIEKRYRDKFRELLRGRSEEWRKNHADKYKLCVRRSNQKHSATIAGNIERRIRCALWRSLRGANGWYHWEKRVGYSMDDLRKHIESLFTEGMTWDKFLKGEIHIDHIIPVSRLYFNSYDDPTFKFCFSLSNLQPLWKEDNLLKKARII